MKRILGLLIGMLLAGEALGAEAGRSLLVLGVIASVDPETSVALLKKQGDGQTFAARVGQEVEQRTFIRRVTREFVYFEKNGRLEKVRVGEELGDAAFVPLAIEQGVDRRGNVVRLTSALREHIVKRELSRVLMQAAAVPYYEAGALRGFRLWDIDPGSLYEKAGFENGDIVTAVNGQLLTDVALTVRMLQSLKDEPRADVTFTRQGTEQTIQILVE